MSVAPVDHDQWIALAMSGWAFAVVVIAMAILSLRRSEARMELVARAAHEIRGPLFAARLGIHLIARDESKRAGSPARAAAVDLELRRTTLALADLDAARFGRRALDARTTVDVGDLLRSSAVAWRPVALAAGGDLELRLPVGCPAVSGDRVRLSQACGNLLANAIEHGSGQVQLCAVAVDDRIRIEVSDDGPGLPASMAELTRRPRSGRGSRGRGLAIVAEIAHRHGGQLASIPNTRGARVAIDLPTVSNLTAA
ncbi:MAG: HAMP domain-containing sensor histidine kinase [Actinomycetota bacterium]